MLEKAKKTLQKAITTAKKQWEKIPQKYRNAIVFTTFMALWAIPLASPAQVACITYLAYNSETGRKLLDKFGKKYPKIYKKIDIHGKLAKKAVLEGKACDLASHNKKIDTALKEGRACSLTSHKNLDKSFVKAKIMANKEKYLQESITAKTKETIAPNLSAISALKSVATR